MASSAMAHALCFVSSNPPKCCFNNQTLALTHSHFLSSPSFLRLRRKALFSNIKFNKPLSPKPVVYALQANFFKVLQTAWKVGKDGIDAGTNLVPDSVPRPIARVAVSIVALIVTSFVLSSFLSAALFAVATMGFVYFIFLALNKDQGPRGGSGTGTGTGPMEDPVEEARKIMEKYK